MTDTSFDALVIGSGQAGTPLATRLAAHGWKTAIVERGELGGTCVNNGCTPTKTLVASARAAWVAKNAGRFGVRIAGEVSIDYAAVRARMLAVVQQSRDGLAQWIASTPGLTRVQGEARFLGPDRVQVAEQVLQAPRIFLNVGARPVVPEWIASSGVRHLTRRSSPRRSCSSTARSTGPASRSVAPTQKAWTSPARRS